MLPLLLRRRDQGREGGRARRPVPFQIGREPRIAADRRRRCRCCRRPIGRGAISRRRRSTPPLGSGPYKIEAVDPGRSITYRRVADYWAADLPVSKGRYNVDAIRYDYYRDATIALEAFKAGQYDVRLENSSKDWATGYDSPALRARADQEGGDPERAAERHAGLRLQSAPAAVPGPAGAPGARPMPSISNGRTRTCSTAPTSARAAISTIPSWPRPGVPQGEELKILEPFRGKIPDEVFTKEYDPPKYDGSGNIRDGLREALKLLKEAGLELQGREAGQRQDRPALRVRDPARQPAVRAHRAALCARISSGWASPRACAPSTPRNTRSAWRPSTTTWPSSSFGAIAVARQRAARVLGLASRRRAGQPQPARHQEPGRRRAGRGADQGARPRRASSPTRMRSTGCCSTAIT